MNDGLCGIIPVFKPGGWTSFDVVAKLRGILHTKKIGHSGTLDPIATGVLPIFIGKATRAADLLPDSKKTYKAGFRLGVTTDTQDITGEVLSASDVSVSREELERACEGFVGDIMQIPPMYSAVKVGGKKLCDLARRGETAERSAKARRIDFISIWEYDEHTREGVLCTSVSKGTYIRTLINDIGEALGCGGVMTSLQRQSAGGFELDDCYTLEQLQQAADEGSLDRIIAPTESVFTGAYESIQLGERETVMYKNGVRLRLEQVGAENAKEHKTVCIFGFGGAFLGLGLLDTGDRLLKSIRNFY